MRKKFPLIGCYLLAFLLACVGLTFTCSCDHFKGHLTQPDAFNDTTLVEQCVYGYFNPTFDSVESVIEFQSGIQQDQKVDSFIGTINSDKLVNIASVLFKRKEPVTLLSLYKEYQCNRQVYDNLPIDAPNTDNSDTSIEKQSKDKETAVEEQHRRVDEPTMANRTQKSVTYTDTTINGKRCTIETRLYE